VHQRPVTLHIERLKLTKPLPLRSPQRHRRQEQARRHDYADNILDHARPPAMPRPPTAGLSVAGTAPVHHARILKLAARDLSPERRNTVRGKTMPAVFSVTTMLSELQTETSATNTQVLPNRDQSTATDQR